MVPDDEAGVGLLGGPGRREAAHLRGNVEEDGLMTTTTDIVAKLWSMCHVLRDDGVTYNEYVTELTFLLFLKMLGRKRRRRTACRRRIAGAKLAKREGLDQLDYYKRLLLDLGKPDTKDALVRTIFTDAQTRLRKPTNLKPAGLEKSVGLISAIWEMTPGDPRWEHDPGYLTYLAFMKQYYSAGDPNDVLNFAGYAWAYSGPLSNVGTIGRAEAAYFRMLNEHGGVNGRKITFVSLDDAYSPPKTVERVRKLVEQDQVLAIFGIIGTTTSASVQQYLNERRKVPQLFIQMNK